ncbi:Hypothetical protein PBC10988_29000 [Planctomycetales bacterium 10988]|nr:Hypothetical protein PBC10988_29000 [Planctomycetales bacterium 10988]
MSLPPLSTNSTSDADKQTLSRRCWLRRMLSLGCGAGLAQVFAGGLPQAFAQQPVAVREGSADRAFRDEAVRAIPYRNLSPRARSITQEVIQNTAVYRRLPMEMIACDPEFYLFVVNRPDTVVGIWENLGISEVKLNQTGTNTYVADDGRGTKTDIEFLHRSHDKHLILAKGSYEGPLLKRTLNGQCLMLLRTGYMTEKDGTYFVAHQIDAFLKIDDFGAKMIAKTLQQMFGKVADQNFSEISSFVGSLAQKAERDPQWVEQMTTEMRTVHPQVRQEMVKLAHKLADRKDLKAAEQPTSGGTPTRQTSVRRKISRGQ